MRVACTIRYLVSIIYIKQAHRKLWLVLTKRFIMKLPLDYN